tara:strand:+ start:1099 stop:1287 length:189 start_codon:yes stop_codon:yes gene_type:complete
MSYKGKYLQVVETQGVFKKGARCYCIWETDEYIYLYFQIPVLGDINEVKILKNNLTNFKIVL